jgi:hypothetical protein
MKYLCRSSAELVVRVVTLSCRFGYVYVVTGTIPKHKDPLPVDRKLMDKYGVRRDRMKAMREHRQGLAKVKYLRWRDRFLLLATDGESSLFEEERPVDLRRMPVRIGDYVVKVKVINGKPSVQLSARCYKRLRDQILASALSPKADRLLAVPRLKFEGVFKQLRRLKRTLRRKRKRAGYRRGKRQRSR